eukprot:2461130-Pyramimonas_sp.AAC.1
MVPLQQEIHQLAHWPARLPPFQAEGRARGQPGGVRRTEWRQARAASKGGELAEEPSIGEGLTGD